MVLVGSQWSVAAEEDIRPSMVWTRGMVSRGVRLVVVCRSVREESVAEPVTHSTRESGTVNCWLH